MEKKERIKRKIRKRKKNMKIMLMDVIVFN